MSTNVTSVEPATRINPGRVGSPIRLDQTLAAQGRIPARRLTRLDADYYAAQPRTPTWSAPAPRAPMIRPATDRAWLRLLERAIGGLAPTLRQSVALVALFLAAAIAVVITLGIVGAVLVSCLGIALAWRQVTTRR